ncbi:hypothetical protein DIPPA_08358 [Diplonema papillatum]|nr:hypothetical protein DIPPA_08358 [Diplonema papillatum]
MTIAAGSSGPQVENGEEIEMPEVESEDDGTVVSRSVASTTAAGGAAAPGGSVPAHDPTLRGEILGLVSPSFVRIWTCPSRLFSLALSFSLRVSR